MTCNHKINSSNVNEAGDSIYEVSEVILMRKRKRRKLDLLKAMPSANRLLFTDDGKAVRASDMGNDNEDSSDEEDLHGISDYAMTVSSRLTQSVGAGWGALMSSHVRLVGPQRVMEGSKLEVRVDGVPLGVVKRLSSNCEKRTGEQSEKSAPEVCVIAYGVPWNAFLYDDGQPHLLTIHSASQRHASHPFSFNGVPETGMKARVIRLLSALFSLSDFEAMSPKLCSLGFLFTFAFCIPGLLRKRAATFVLFTMAALLRFGPAFIVTYQLREADAGLGMAGLKSVWLPSSFHPSGVDLPYMLSVTVLFGSLVPVSFLDAVMSSRQATILQRSTVARVWVPFYLLKSLSWCLEVVGAHGILAVLISPSCVPLFIACSVSVMMSFNALAKKED